MLNTAFLSCLLHVLHCSPLLFFFRYKFIIFWSVLQEKKRKARLSNNDTMMHKWWNEQKKVFYCIGLKLKLYYATQGIVVIGDLAAHYNQGCTILLPNTYATLLLKRLTCFNLIFFSWFSWPSMNYFYFVRTVMFVKSHPSRHFDMLLNVNVCNHGSVHSASCHVCLRKGYWKDLKINNCKAETCKASRTC